ncbi:MAG: hypothetical protein N0C91_15890 [Candidatus Thiodiazotropha endolucinida]|nr:hypothetical protein [Candidatus Thiodiazotropha taylori]MCG8103857.1 hypothetical protein [Candidatus Thiodiazotropha taylori]MCW4264102.1 hypothetical protein [Candidatus Thiodiazotropha endolucinida]MCW4289185.1 hypothetical protein [Candidatus Thiodiazotropha endolucinida]
MGTYDFTQGGQYSVTLSDDADSTYVIADAIMVVPEDATGNTANWTFDISETGQYQVYAKWTAYPNRASNATYVVTDDVTDTSVTVDQRTDGSIWNLLGTFNFSQGENYQVSLSNQADGYVIADAVKVVPVNATLNTATWSFSVPQAGSHRVFARWTSNANRATDAQYTVVSDAGESTVSVNQQLDGGVWNLLGTYNFIEGVGYEVRLPDQAGSGEVADAIQILPDNATPNRFSWQLPIPQTGQYVVYARWTAHPNNATNAIYTIQSDDGVTTVQKDQQTSGAKWNWLGTFNFTQGGDYQVYLTDETDGYVIADGVRIVPVTPE